MTFRAKITAIAAEQYGAKPTMETFRYLLDHGWKIHHEEGTAFVALHHPAGGKCDLLEVKTYGTALTTGEADLIAKEIAEFLASKYEPARRSQRSGRIDRPAGL